MFLCDNLKVFENVLSVQQKKIGVGDIFAIYFNFALQKSLRKDTEYSSPAFSLQDSSYWADEETISHSQRLVYSQWKKNSEDPTSTKILFPVKNF